MKKIILMVALACAAAVQAQDEPSMWGVRVGVDMNLPGDWHVNGETVDMYRHGFGVNAGVVYNAWLGRGFWLEPGVALYYDSYGYSGLSILETGSGGNQSADPSLYKVGVRVPVVVGYTFDVTPTFAMDVFTGPELNYSFGGKVRVKGNEWLDSELFGAFQRRADLAWRVGVGLPMYPWRVSVDGAFGLTDLIKTPASCRDNRVTVSLTYYF